MGSESELQTAVIGSRDRVDLPRVIGESNYYRNIIKRARTGEFPQRIISGLEHFLRNNQDNVWENSWVRVPLHALHLRRSCPELIEHFGALDLLRELTDRIKYPGNSAPASA